MSRATSFLDLPREIRDLIYNYVLVSPTNYITALYPPSSSSNSTAINPATNYLKRPPRSHLHIIPCDLSPQNKLTDKRATDYTLPSLSICRVSRQLYHETKDIFYTQNAYFTSHPFKSTSTYPDLPHFLKELGQSASRRLQTIVILLPYMLPSYKFLGKILQALSSRARHGDFKKLVLRIDQALLQIFTYYRQDYMNGRDSGASKIWELLTRSFREAGGKACRFEREVVCLDVNGKDGLKRCWEAVADINRAFGGRFLWRDELVWLDGEAIEAGRPGQ